jgi:hypothetical protein
MNKYGQLSPLAYFEKRQLKHSLKFYAFIIKKTHGVSAAHTTALSTALSSIIEGDLCSCMGHHAEKMTRHYS